MNYLHFRRAIAITAALITFGLGADAAAQYVWTDEKGIKQYSDLPPPSSIPANRIIKQPDGPVTSPIVDNRATTPTKNEMTIAEKNAEFRKRRIEQAEKDKKAEEERKLSAEKAKNCERAREYNRTLESGVRMSRVNKNGERTFLSDEQRIKELNEAKSMLKDCK